MTIIRALADDLTGAFDTGASFVSLSGPIPIVWAIENLPSQGSYILDNETRQIQNASQAREKTLSDLKHIKDSDIAFKKIDSLMRGHTIVEVETCIKSGEFESIVIAPSFPQQQRITRGQQQFAKFFPEDDWHPVGPNLSEAFISIRNTNHIDSSSKVAGGGLFIYDAETEEDMNRIPDIFSAIQDPILWCGSAGLARALSGQKRATNTYQTASTLAIIGSQHPVSQTQLTIMRDIDPDSVVMIDKLTPLNSIVDSINTRLANGEHSILALSINHGTPSAMRDELDDIIYRLLPRLSKPERLFAMGGDTLLASLRAVAACQTSVKGELSPGIAIGEITGGLWDQITFLSKSGAFGHPTFLRDLLCERLPERY